MAEAHDRTGEPQPAAETGHVGTSGAGRASRRQVVKGAVAATAALGIAGYVKPSVRLLGVPAALAISSPAAGGEASTDPDKKPKKPKRK